MKNFPIVSRALLTAFSKANYPAAEILWHLRTAYHFGDMLSEQNLRGHLDQAREHAESVLALITSAQADLDRACRGGAVTVIPIGDGGPIFAGTLALVGREMAREMGASV